MDEIFEITKDISVTSQKMAMFKDYVKKLEASETDMFSVKVYTQRASVVIKKNKQTN